MTIKSTDTVSAEVMMRPASGAVIDGETLITADNIKDFLPAGEAAEKARGEFLAAGFTVSPLTGISFSITASIERFEDFFKTRLIERARGEIMASSGDGSESYELPLGELKGEVAANIISITFTPPPDFGPCGFL